MQIFLKAYLMVVSGRVQGVGYRASVYEIATRTGITGHVRNMDDGRVEILAQSWENEKLESFLESITSVRLPARVYDVTKTEVEFSDDVRNFRIVH
jgi:acylphosphatase